MLLECTCGKMFRVRDGAAAAPTKCPSCGGTLREASGRAAPPSSTSAPAPAAPAAPAADTGRVKEMEARIAELEKAAAGARAAVEAKAGEVEEMAGRLAQAQKAKEEASQEAAKAKSQGGRVQQLEKELAEARAKAQQAGLAAIKEKDTELHYAQERIAALEREVQGAQGGTKSRDKELIDLRARVSAMNVEHKESQDAIAKLGDELHKAQDAYKTTLANKEKEIEELHAKVAEGSGGTKGPGGADPGLARAQARIAMLERIVQDGEQRYRTLNEEFHKSTENAHSTTADSSRAIETKDAKIVDLEAAVARNKNRADELEKKLKTSSEDKATAAPVPAANIDQARYLAADLDRSLASVSSMLQGLVERVKRLNGTLAKPEGAAGPVAATTEEEGAPAAPAATWGRPAAPPPDEETKSDLPAVEEAPVEAEGEVEAVELESLPDQPQPAEDDGGLPADETLLDMGGASMGKKVRDAMARRNHPAPPPPPAEEEPAAEELPAEEAAFEEQPAEEGAPAEEAAPEAEQPKKKGLFGKLFGRKK